MLYRFEMASIACPNCNQTYPESDIFYCHACEEYFCSSCGFKNHRDSSKHITESASEHVANASAVLLKDVDRLEIDHADFHSLVLAIEEVENSLNAIKEIKHNYMKAVKSDSIFALKEQLKEQPLSAYQFSRCWEHNKEYRSELRSATQKINKALAPLSDSVIELQRRGINAEGLQARLEETEAAVLDFKNTQRLGRKSHLLDLKKTQRPVITEAILLIGGLSSQNQYVDSAVALQLKSSTSIKCSHIPELALRTGRGYHQSVAISGTVVTLGGYNGECLSSVECVDLGTHANCDLRDMINARYLFAAGVIGNIILVCGGSNGNELNLCEYYDIDAAKWNLFQNMHNARWWHAGAVLGDNFYATGGYPNDSTVECYNPAANKWTMCPRLNQGRHWHGCAALEGRLYVCGGSSFIKSCECYDPRDNNWNKFSDMKNGRHYFATAASAGKLYAIGGYTKGGVSGSVEIYDPRNDKWITVDDAVEPRYYMSAVVI